MSRAWAGSLHTDQQPAAEQRIAAEPTPSPREAPAWLAPGGPYDVDERDYHADRTALSSSGARTLTTSCPARFKWERDNGRPDTPAMEFGRAYHSMVLGSGPKVVEIKAKTRGTKAEDQARADGHIPLITKDYERAVGMAAALYSHPIAGPLFARAGTAEQVFVAPDPDTGVLCKIRVDWMPRVFGGRPLLVDLKTCNDAQPAAFAKSMANYGYHQQGAFYSDVLSWAGADNGQTPRFVLVAQEKEPPYLVMIAEPDDQATAWGRELNRQALFIYRWCTGRDEWPGYEADLPADHGGIARLALPGWQVAAYEAAYDRRRQALELIGAPA